VNITDQENKDIPRLTEAIHALSARTDLFTRDNQGLQEAPAHKEKHSKRAKPLSLQKHKDYRSGLVF